MTEGSQEVSEARDERAQARLVEFRRFDPPWFSGESIEPWVETWSELRRNFLRIFIFQRGIEYIWPLIVWRAMLVIGGRELGGVDWWVQR